MSELYKLKTEELLGESVKCECGAVHKADIPVVVGSGVGDECEKLIGCAGRVLVFTGREVSRDYCDDLHDELTEKGFIVQRFSHTGQDEAGLIEEGTNLIVAVGDEIVVERAKLMAQSMNVKLLVVPTSFALYRFSRDNSVLDYGGIRVTCPSRAPSVIVVRAEVFEMMKDGEFCAVLGELYSKIVAFIDYYYGYVVHGKGCDRLSFSAIECLKTLNATGFSRTGGGMEKIIDCAIRVNALLSFGAVEEGGESQLATTVERFVKENNRRRLPRGEVLFLSAVAVAKTYKTFLKGKVGYGIKDVAGDIERAQKLMAVGYREGLSLATGYDENYKYQEYKLGLRRGELKDLCESAIEVLMVANARFHRLYVDGGYHVRYFLTVDETLSLISLSPFYLSRETLLTFIKERGLLELGEDRLEKAF